jgi:TRIAD3 protein (E3 ubiquitin-protein ligase RNF216)
VELALTWAENEKDRGLDKRHAIEDAMSAALIRQCPNDKCKKPFVKETGCNKITVSCCIVNTIAQLTRQCTSCRTLSCYICRQIIKDYSHFDQRTCDLRARKAC